MKDEPSSSLDKGIVRQQLENKQARTIFRPGVESVANVELLFNIET
jgi:hypothetical protein